MRTMLLLMVIVSMTAYAQQPTSLEDTLVWMENFAADKGNQYTGQRNTDQGACKLGTPRCDPRHDATTFDSHGCLATIKWSVAVNYKDLGTHTYTGSGPFTVSTTINEVAGPDTVTTSSTATITNNLVVTTTQQTTSGAEIDAISLDVKLCGAEALVVRERLGEPRQMRCRGSKHQIGAPDMDLIVFESKVSWRWHPEGIERAHGPSLPLVSSLPSLLFRSHRACNL